MTDKYVPDDQTLYEWAKTQNPGLPGIQAWNYEMRKFWTNSYLRAHAD